jgi:DNA adenine methylase
MKQIKSDDFAFIDPPYLERLGYQDADGGLDLHSQLHKLVVGLTDTPWMIIHSDHEFYREMYKDYNIHTNEFMYSQRFGKNKQHTNARVTHLYITNYTRS